MTRSTLAGPVTGSVSRNNWNNWGQITENNWGHTPPGRPAHVFTYTAVDQTQDATPPTVDSSDPATHYLYNKDRQLELITRPDGQTLDYLYDTAGRLKTLSAPHGDTGYSYENNWGQNKLKSCHFEFTLTPVI